MCRDTIRAASRSITACSGPNCGSSAGCISSPPRISRPQSAPDGETASWTIETKASDWQTRTGYDFLRFEDLIQRDLAAPIWRTVFHAMWIYWRLVFSGTIARFWKAHWRFATFITYPHFLLLIEALCRCGIAFALRQGPRRARRSRRPSASPRRRPCSSRCSAALLKYTENLTYRALSAVRHDLDLGVLAPRSGRNGTSASTALPNTSSNVARDSDAEEIVVVGHSSGSFLGAEILARALKLDPALGRHGPRIVLLTHRRQFPDRRVSCRRSDFRDHLRQLAVEPSIDWIDCQSRKDVMNFYPFDPIAGHGIDVGAARRNPTIVPVRFREIIKPEHYNLFRWQFFRVHFQFVMANERPHAYDFFMIVCGPIPLRERMARPEAALAIATGDAAARERAWKRLETAAASRADAADLGEMEPSARRRG